MDRSLRLGYSPCPNDTFIFFALAEGQISTTPYELEISLADVEILNQQARQRVFDITKVSISAVLHLLDRLLAAPLGRSHRARLRTPGGGSGKPDPRGSPG